MVLRLSVLALTLLAAFPLSADPTAAEIAALVAKLDDDDAEARETATTELIRIGEPAAEAVRKAEREGSPEVRGRAARILREYRAVAILARPGNAVLRARLDDIRGGDFKKRRAGVSAWVASLGRSEATVDALLELAEADPTGTLGDAALEALNTLLHPALLRKLTGPSVSSVHDARGAVESLRSLETWGLNFRLSDAAKPLVEETVMPARSSDTGKPLLDEVRLVCLRAGVVCRLDGAKGEVVLETAAESIEWWKGWWTKTKADEAACVALGLRSGPDPAKLTEAELADFVKRLDSADAKQARAARRVLREIPDARIAELKKLAKGDAAASFVSLLDRRHDARLLLIRSGDTGVAYVARADGSGARRVSGDLAIGGEVMPCAGGGVAATSPEIGDERLTIWRLDLDGAEAPVKVCDGATVIAAHPQGREVVARTASLAFFLLDIRTGARREIQGVVDGRTAAFSPDGKRIASWADGGIVLVDAGTAALTRLEGTKSFGGTPRWSPDGTRLAWVSGDLQAPVKGRFNITIDVWDSATGERKTVIGPHQVLGEPEWSPDGTRIAVSRLSAKIQGDVPLTLEVASLDGSKPIEIADGFLGMSVPAMIGWTPDGQAILWKRGDKKAEGQRFDLEKRTRETIPWHGISHVRTKDGWTYAGVLHPMLVSPDGATAIPVSEEAEMEFVTALLAPKE